MRCVDARLAATVESVSAGAGGAGVVGVGRTPPGGRGGGRIVGQMGPVYMLHRKIYEMRFRTTFEVLTATRLRRTISAEDAE